MCYHTVVYNIVHYKILEKYYELVALNEEDIFSKAASFHSAVFPDSVSHHSQPLQGETVQQK